MPMYSVFCNMKFDKAKMPETLEHPIRPGIEPFTKIAFDIMDIKYGTQNLYARTMVDLFSRYASVEIIRRKTTGVMTKALIRLLGPG